MSRTHLRARSAWPALAIVLASLMPAGRGPGQTAPASDAASKILSDPEKALQDRADKLKEKQRPPIEFFRSQILPNDILPYLKANHWTMVGIELRANHDDYEGLAPVEAGRPWPASPTRSSIAGTPGWSRGSGPG